MKTSQLLEDRSKYMPGAILYCEICGRWIGGYSKSGCILAQQDHDHKTGKLRGLLCIRCNVGLGFFKDKPMMLLKAAIYLKKYRGIKK